MRMKLSCRSGQRLVVYPGKAIFLSCGRSSTQLMRDSLGRALQARMNRIPYWLGAALGAIATAGYQIWELGWPSPDGFVLTLLAILVAFGALVGGGIVLAWRHIRGNPRVLRLTVAMLIVLSLPPMACY
jgi:hypothetical protein